MVALSAVHAFPQPSAASDASPRPFAVGETLVYKGEFNKILNGLDFGDMTFSIVPNSGPGGFVIRSEARSRGTLMTLLRFSFVQRYDSVVDSEVFRADKTLKFDQQRDRIRESETVFDYDTRRVTFSERNPKTPMGAPRVIASELTGDTHDAITAIYALRTMPLEVGRTFTLAVSDSGLVYSIPVTVAAREIQKTVLGKVMCFKVVPDVFGKDKFFGQEGSMVIWITDTPARIPVRSQLKLSVGRIEIKLRSYNPPRTGRPD